MLNFLKYKAAPVLIFLVLLLGFMHHQAGKAQASTSPLPGHSSLEYCNLVADYGEAAAQDRDAGVDILTALALASEVNLLNVRIDFVTTTYLVHVTPGKTPTELAGLFFELCYATYGAAQ